MRVGFTRYYLPIVVALAPCVGIACGYGHLVLRSLLRRSPEHYWSGGANAMNGSLARNRYSAGD
jgi:hypothetical protein